MSADQAPPAQGTPPQRIVEAAISEGRWSPCRSKRGAVVFREGGVDFVVIARGHNYKPNGFECDDSATCKATCRAEAVHAEQAALIKAGLFAQGCDLLHVKVVEGQLVPSGQPSCVECSKLALAAQIAGVWLYHEDGWRRYDATDFHRRSLEARHAD